MSLWELTHRQVLEDSEDMFFLSQRLDERQLKLRAEVLWPVTIIRNWLSKTEPATRLRRHILGGWRLEKIGKLRLSPNGLNDRAEFPLSFTASLHLLLLGRRLLRSHSLGQASRGIQLISKELKLVC